LQFWCRKALLKPPGLNVRNRNADFNETFNKDPKYYLTNPTFIEKRGLRIIKGRKDIK
jgi:hypothetical protein